MSNSGDAFVRVLIVSDKESEESQMAAFGQILSPEAKSACEEAFYKLEENEVEPQRVTIEECMELVGKTADIYVLPIFSGPLFKRFKNMEQRVYGPPIVMEVLGNTIERDRRVPKVNHPLFCSSLKGCMISFTGITSKERDELTQICLYMYGRISHTLAARTTTHLIASEIGSEKYHVAARHSKRIQILTKNWITDAWKLSQTKMMRGTNLDFMRSYTLPIFAGVYATVSNIDRSERENIKQILEENGGNYSGTMLRHQTTHLITSKFEGQKCEVAQEWGSIKIVNGKWLKESVLRGHALPEVEFNKFHRDPRNNNGLLARASTPLQSTNRQVAATNSHPRSLPDPNLSIIPPATNNGAVPKLNMADSITVSDSTAEDSSVGNGGKKTAFEPHNKCLENVDWTTVDEPPSSDFLENTIIYFTGFTKSEDIQLKRIVNGGGGSRAERTSGRVTHAVVGGVRPNLSSLKQLSSNTPVLKAEWIVDSFVAGRQMPVNKDYLHSYVNSTLGPDAIDETPATSRAGKRNRDWTETDDGSSKDTLNESMSKKPRSERLLSFGKPKDMDPPSTSREDVLHEIPEQPAERDEPKAHSDGLRNSHNASTAGNGGILKGLTFRIEGFPRHAIAKMREWVELDLGKYADGPECDYLILPYLVLEHEDYSRFRPKYVASNVWLQKSLEDGRMCDIEGSHALFKVYRCSGNRDPAFSKCVVCVSGFDGCARDSIGQLVLDLGGTFQETLCRKDKMEDGEKVYGVTHLILPGDAAARGQKFELAKRWKIPCVRPDWLFDTLKSDWKLRPVDGYLIGGDDDTSRRPCSPLPVPYFELAPRKKVNGNEERINPSTTPVSTSFLDPEKSFRPQFDLADAINYIDSNKHHESPDLAKEASKALEKANSKMAAVESIMNTPDGGKPIESRTPKHHASANRSTRSASGRVNGGRDRFGPLSGVVAAICAQKNLNALKDMLLKLGGYWRPNFDANCTHLICSADSDIESEADIITLARRHTVEIVHADWLKKCFQQNEHLHENEFPFFERPRSEIAKPTFVRTESSVKAAKAPSSSLDINNAKEILARKKRRMMIPEMTEQMNQAIKACRESPKTSKKVQAPQPKGPMPWELEESVEKTTDEDRPKIGWDDTIRVPDKKGGGEKDNGSHPKPSTSKQADEPVPVTSTSKPKPVFLFSNLPDSVRKTLEKIVVNLGGRMSMDIAESATHLITQEKVPRNEKTFTAIASGSWILDKSYLLDSEKEGTFLPEEEYEFIRCGKLNPQEAGSSYAALQFWRERIAQTGKGPFVGWKVAIFGKPSRATTFQNILLRGGAEVALIGDRKLCMLGLTHVILCNPRPTWNEVPMLKDCAVNECGVFEDVFVSHVLDDCNELDQTMYYYTPYVKFSKKKTTAAK